MKRALQGLLIAGKEMRDSVIEGEKKITIREGHRDYTEGPVLIGCNILNWAVLKTIKSVKHTTLKEVTRLEWLGDNFRSQDDMVEGLRNFYPSITLDSPVTVIQWDDK